MTEQRIGFVGAGQMGRALAFGFADSGLIEGRQLSAYDPSPGAVQQLSELIPEVTIAPSGEAVVAEADITFLAVKPQRMEAVARGVAPAVSDRSLIVSIAAGIPLARLAEWLGSDRLIRVMPNTPCLVGDGASGYCAAAGATESDVEVVGSLLGSVGLAVPIEERLMDALTGLSGSGPAYVYTFIEALSDGGVKMGLPRPVASALAAHTVRGAAAMVVSSGEHTAVLRDRVTSPGGTTIAGLAALEQGGFRAAVINAVEAAARRSAELGNG
jgi:pyrroline-5-carboxylate reductase